MVEFLAGSLLAVAWSYRPDPLAGRARRAVGAVGAGSLAVMLALWATADFNNRTVYSGGLAAYSLLTLAVIVAGMQPGSVVQQALAFKPLAWIGVVSYGAYLVHFPILIWLDSHTRLATPTRLFVSIPATLLLAGASARFLERPIRSQRRLSGHRAWIAMPIAIGVAAGSIFVVTAVARPSGSADPFADLPQLFERDIAELELVVGDSRAPRVAVFGDSTALITGLGVMEYSIDHPEEVVSRRGWAELGCGLLTDVTRRVQGEEQSVPERCSEWRSGWVESLTAHPLDVAAVLVGPFDVRDQQLVPDGPFLTIGEDAELDDALREALRERVDTLLEHSGMVVLLASPDIDVGRVDGRSPNDRFAESDPARMERFREILGEVADETANVEVLDLAGWFASRSDDRELRPDGVHLIPETTGTVAEWLVPELLRMHEERTGSNLTTVDTSAAH
ncbi:MAG: acyltransferase [Acidimicrobiia bacterium]|nr:acyltransferase [Acidimicrobiia bacterium]